MIATNARIKKFIRAFVAKQISAIFLLKLRLFLLRIIFKLRITNLYSWKYKSLDQK